MKQTEKGSSSVIVAIVVLLLAIAGLIYANFYLLGNPANLPTSMNPYSSTQTKEKSLEEAENAESVSDASDSATIEEELDATVVGSMDGEFDDLDSSGNSLY